MLLCQARQTPSAKITLDLALHGLVVGVDSDFHEPVAGGQAAQVSVEFAFAAGGVVISLLVEALHSARRRAEESTEEAQRHQETLHQSSSPRRPAKPRSTSKVRLRRDPAGWNEPSNEHEPHCPMLDQTGA